MFRVDFFSGASERWRSQAASRARRVRIDHPEDPLAYADKRLGMAKLGSFERRRWKYIKKLIVKELDA